MDITDKKILHLSMEDFFVDKVRFHDTGTAAR